MGRNGAERGRIGVGFNMCGFTPCVLRQNNKQIVRLSEGLTMTQDPVSSPACAPASLYSSVAAGVPRCAVPSASPGYM